MFFIDEILSSSEKSFEVMAEELAKKPFEEQVDEWANGTRAMFGKEVFDHLIRGMPIPKVPVTGPRVTARGIQDYADSLGDDNPLYTDPGYAAKTRYGYLIAPPTYLLRARYTVGHGYTGGRGYSVGQIAYPLANYFSGTLFEWHNVIPVGTRFLTSCRNRQLLEKKGRKGRLFFLACEAFYWNQSSDLLGKARGHIIFVPLRARHDVDNIGKGMLYERPTHRYTNEEVKKVKEDLDGEVRRGAETRYWEDVEVGDIVPSTVEGPFSLAEQTGGTRGWEKTYKWMKRTAREYIHPVTKWPWSTAAEHEDPLLCKYRGLPGPFDGGAHRVQVLEHPLVNWAGDDGFLRKLYVEIRKPNYYGDVTWFNCKVIEKYKVKEVGEAGPGGVPGEAEYAAVDIEIMGINQVGEKTTPGRATIFLPSHELGSVQLPIPHLARPPGEYTEPTPEYIPFPSYSLEKEVRVARGGL